MAIDPDFARPLTQCSDTSGSGTAQSCSFPVVYEQVPQKGDAFVYYTTTTNTGPLTINVNGSGAAPVLKWQGTALAAGDIQANKPVLMTFDGTNWLVSTIGNAPSGSSVTLNYFQPSNDRNGTLNPRNGNVALWAFVPPANVTFTHILVHISTADSSGLYSWGIYSSTGDLVASVTAASYAATGTVDLATIQGSKTLTGGQRYYFGITGNATVLAIWAGADEILPVNNGSGSATTAGVLPATTTIPSDSWLDTANEPYFVLHN